MVKADTRSLAYSIYEHCGREHGHDIDDWLCAETEVTAQLFATVGAAS
jgi:hypothetical protein